MHLSTIDVRLDYLVQSPTHFCFNLEAAHCADQHILEEHLQVSPALLLRRFRDDDNGNRFVRFDAQPGALSLRYRARVQALGDVPPSTLPEVPVSQVPDEVFRYLLPSRYCESDVMAACAQQMFGQHPPGLARVRAIVDWLHASLRYVPGSTDSTTSAQDVFVQRAGVCRDFAHLGITFCRALNIPARLVVGYVWFDEPPQDFHAVFEAWLGGRWVSFDPTGMAPVERLVRSGTGRDAKDVAFSTIFGVVRMTRKDIVIDERAHPGQHDIEEWISAQAAAEEA